MHRSKHLTVSLLFCLSLLGASARAQEDEPGKDHPSVPRFPGMMMVETDQTDFDGFDFPTEPENCEENTKRVEGRHWRFSYTLKEGARKASPLEMVRNYASQFRARGGRVVCQRMDGSHTAVATMMMPLSQGERWLRLEIFNEARDYYMRIIETAEMKQKLEFSADEMAEMLKSSGKLTLRGILFDTGKTNIKPESDALLDEIAAMLKAEAQLKLRIEGHTDNVGAKASNLQLSKGRASALKAALVARGIAAERFTTEGYGDTKPVADNTTEEGRAQNRRVELVRQ
jgi:OOP family OmpA-OmpF porin